MKKTEKQKEEQNYKSYSVWSNYRYALGLMYRWFGIPSFVRTACGALVSIAQPFLALALPSVVTALLSGERPSEQVFLLLTLYLLLLQGLQVARAHYVAKNSSVRMNTRILAGLDMYDGCMNMDYQNYESKTGQEKGSAATRAIWWGNDVGLEAFIKDLENTAVALGGLLVYSIIIGRESPPLMLLLLTVTALSSAIRVLATRRAVPYDKKLEKEYQNYKYLRRESLLPANGKDIRLYHMWSWFIREFEDLKESMAHWSAKFHGCNITAKMLTLLITFLKDLLVYGYLLSRMVQGSISLAAFLLYVGIAAGFQGFMTQLMDSIFSMLQNSLPVSRFRDFLEYAALPCSGSKPVARPGQVHEIRLEHVSFRYPDSEKYVIEDLSLSIHPGEKLALVGVNGAGKSTLVKLICGLYHPVSGKIYLDGQDVSTLSSRDYFREFSVVFQDVFAFSFPLEENVSCRPGTDTDAERLHRSLKQADLWEKVQSLEKKEKTWLNKDMDPSGISLSGGELQRLMLARALYKNAPFVILDEPTAALDPIAESRMYEKYYDMTREKTSIFISHRLSSTRFCDRILFMEAGRITEEGDHESLMERNGAYAHMFHTQAQYYQKETEDSKRCMA